MSDAPQPAGWTGFRRPRGQPAAPWEAVPGTEAATKAEAYALLMRESELRAGVYGPYEYTIVPAGERPKGDWPGGRPGTYGHRMLRPRS